MGVEDRLRELGIETAENRAFRVEQRGIEYVPEDQRTMRPRELAGLWAGAIFNVEYVVFGTAVRETTLARSDSPGPRMCALSAQDVDKLRRIGAETLSVVGHTSVVAVALSVQANQMMRSWWGNQEMTEVTEGVYAARHLAMEEVTRQARQAGANDMVISTLTHDIAHHEYERLGFAQHFFIVSMHVLGTAIRLGAHESHPAPLGMPVLSINLGA